MKIFFMSDIHGSPDAAAAALEAYQREGARHIAFLGDALYHGPRNLLPLNYDPAKTADILNRFKEKIIAVRGNCDSEVDQMMLEFPMMGDVAVLLAEDRRVVLTHGHLTGPGYPPALSPGDILVSGHTHLPGAEKRNGTYHLNPGSVTMPKENHPPSYGLLSDDALIVKELHSSDALMTCILR